MQREISFVIKIIISYQYPKKLKQLLSTKRKRHEEAKNEIVNLRDEISKLNTKLDYKIEDLNKDDKYADLLIELFQKGIINSDGKFISEKINF